MNESRRYDPRLTYILIAAMAAFPGAGLLAQSQAQSQESATTIAVDVKVVTLPVTVRDKHEKIVRDLTKDDFTLQEDGRAQTIKYFSQDTNLPLTLGPVSYTHLDVYKRQRVGWRRSELGAHSCRRWEMRGDH